MRVIVYDDHRGGIARLCFAEPRGAYVFCWWPDTKIESQVPIDTFNRWRKEKA